MAGRHCASKGCSGWKGVWWWEGHWCECGFWSGLLASEYFLIPICSLIESHHLPVCQEVLIPLLSSFSHRAFSSVQLLSRVWLCDPMNCMQPARPPCPSPTPRDYPNSCPSSRWCHPAISSSVVPFSSCPQSLSIRVFSNESALRIRWPKYWSFSFSISPSNEHPGLISFRMDRLDLLAVKGTLKSLLQHHSSKRQFFSAQLSSQSNSHIHTWQMEKTIALTRRTFVGKVMSLLFTMLSRLVVTFLLGCFVCFNRLLPQSGSVHC